MIQEKLSDNLRMHWVVPAIL